MPVYTDETKSNEAKPAQAEAKSVRFRIGHHIFHPGEPLNLNDPQGDNNPVTADEEKDMGSQEAKSYSPS
ncbi:MAG: hypothetical protein P1U34_07305 [Coxiellaceae bacterium]|nr:hypothetical protein [Coxiellaceae bacterium]